jgi:hypothetical protein
MSHCSRGCDVMLAASVIELNTYMCGPVCHFTSEHLSGYPKTAHLYLEICGV